MTIREQTIQAALAMVGQEFHAGQLAQCAAFVAHCLNAAGYEWPRAINTSWVPDYSGADNGRPLGRRLRLEEVEPGDLVIFGGTYLDATSTHIGLCTGAYTMVHRPTAARPVELVRFDAGYWHQHFEVGIRLFDVEASKKASGPRKRRFKVYAHDGKLVLYHDGKQVRSTEMKLFANNGKIGIVLNGQELSLESLGLEMVYNELR